MNASNPVVARPAPAVTRRMALRVGRAWASSAPTERGGYRLARALRRFIPRNEWNGVFEVAPGRIVQLDLACYPDCAMAIGVYELDTVRLIRRLLRSGDHFIDVGANIGYLSLMAAAAVGATGRVDALEPMPSTFARLTQNIAANGLAQIIHARRTAVSDQEGALTLHFPDEAHAQGNHGMTSAFLPAGTRHESVDVPCERMDTLFTAATPALVKMDVEGCEPLVIAGMKVMLERASPPNIILELSQTTARNAGYPVEEAVRVALSIQPAYEVHTIGWNARRLQNPLADIGTLGQTNVWLRPALGSFAR